MAQPFQLPDVNVYPEGEEPQMDTGVSMAAPQQDQDTGVSLASPGGAVTEVPNDIATVRAKKMQEGLGKLMQKDTTTMRQEIAAGRDQQLRQEAASKLYLQNHTQKMSMITDLATQKGGPLDEDEVARIMDPFNPKNRPVDPDIVTEGAYAKKFVSSIQDAIDIVKSTPLQDAQREVPDRYQEALEKGTILKQKMDFATKIKEDLGTELKKQTYLGWGADQLKNLFQPYIEAKMRGLNPDVGSISGGILLGTNLQEQADQLFSQPMESYTKNFKAIVSTLAKDNLSLAYKFAEYVEGLPATDRILDNTFTVMAIPDYTAMGKIGLAISRKVSLTNRTNIAMKQLIKEGDQVAASTAGRAEALGDLPTATVEHSTDNIVASVEGKADPIKFAEEALTTNLKQDKDKIATDPGPKLSREQVVRVQDAYDATAKTLLDRILESVRINRIPMAVATQNAVRVIKDAVKEYYPGIRNAILDVSNPLYEPRSNTYWHEITFGNIGGDLFSNPNTAKNFAKLHGFEDVTITEAHGRVTPAQTEALLARRQVVDNNIREAESSIISNKKVLQDVNSSEEAKAAAREQIDGLNGHKKRFEQESDDIGLKLKNKETYDRVKHLENEITRHQIDNKDLRTARRSKEELVDEKGPITKADIDAAIKLNQAQIKAHAQEINALKTGTAEIKGSTTIEQHGVGFKIVVRRPLVETDKAVRDLMIRDASGKLIPEAISTSSQTGWKALMNGAIGKLRGADDTLALNESIQRKIGTYSKSLFDQWARADMKYIRALASGVIRNDPVTGEAIPYWQAKPRAILSKITGNTKDIYNDFSRVLDHARDAKDPVTGKPGYFFETPGQLHDHYMKYFDRAPSFPEVEAYFAYVRLIEGDRVLREVAEFRNRARLGVEQFSISARGPDGKVVKSEFFDGIRRKNFPGGDDVLMVMTRQLGQEKLINLGGSAIAPNQLKEWREAVKTGKMHVIELYASEHTPLKGFSEVAGHEHVRYVLTDSSTTKPMEFNHVNRRGGGHFEYDYEHYIKQAKMYHQYEQTPTIKGRYRSTYVGDTTFMPISNRVMGNDVARKLNDVRELIKQGSEEAAKQYTETHLPIEWDELRGMFKPGKDGSPPALDLNEPFMVVPKNKNIIDMGQGLRDRHGLAFKDGTKSGSLNQQFKTAFNTERDSSGLRTFEDKGTAGRPLYKWDPNGAKMVDPVTTMNRALNRIINSTYMDDYKIYAVEHWLREAEPHLELKPEQVRASPFWAFEQASDKAAFASGTDPEVIRNLLSNRYKIKQFVGVPNGTDTAIHRATQFLVDSVYQRFGPSGLAKLGSKDTMLTPLWMMSRIKDPVDFIRSATFHAKLGLFNPVQLLVQMQTYATIMSVSPLHGTTGTYAALLHGWAAINGDKAILNALDRYASKLSVFGQSKWRPGEWLEANQTLHRTGFGNVAGEYANLNTALKTDYVGNDLRGFLKAGSFFFEKGEQSTRVGAWYTAFREFREANPTKLLTRDDIGGILQRADLLTVNMSRASSSMLHGGVLSLTTQFLSYQLRLAELFMGTRLGGTAAERNWARGRMMLFYSALYGAPSAVGLTGLPMANSIREEAIQRGYVVGDSWIKSAVMEGLPAMALAHITGNQYNIGPRFGSPGFTQFNEAMKSDTSLWKLLAGASGTTLYNTLTATSPFFYAAGSVLQPNNKDKAFPLKLDDFVDLTKEISSANQLWKLIAAINTGKWMSKNEGYIGDVTKANAAFMALVGVNPQAQDDLYLKHDIDKAAIAMQKYYLKEFIQEYRRGTQAAADGNPRQAADFRRRADTLLEISGFPMEKKGTAIALAMKGYESMVKEEDWNFAFKNVPRSRSDFLGIPMPFTTQSNIPQTRQEQFKTNLRKTP